MKLTIQAACENNATLTVAGNVITNGSKDFVLDFKKGEHFYFAVGNGDGTFKGQTTTESALEHLRDSFSFGDITAEAEGMYQQLVYLHKEFNGVYPHLKADEHCGVSMCGVYGSGKNLLSFNAGSGAVYLFRDFNLMPISDPTYPLGYNEEEPGMDVWTVEDKLKEGDVILICSEGVADLLDDEAIEDVMSYSKYPAAHLLDEAMADGAKIPLAVVAIKVGTGDFIPEMIDEEDIPDDTGAYDAWA